MPAIRAEICFDGIYLEWITDKTFRLHLAPKGTEIITTQTILGLSPKRRPALRDDHRLTPIVGAMLVHSVRRCKYLKLLNVYPSYISITMTHRGKMRGLLMEAVTIARRAIGFEFSPVYRLSTDESPPEWDNLLEELFGKTGNL